MGCFGQLLERFEKLGNTLVSVQPAYKTIDKGVIGQLQSTGQFACFQLNTRSVDTEVGSVDPGDIAVPDHFKRFGSDAPAFEVATHPLAFGHDSGGARAH